MENLIGKWGGVNLNSILRYEQREYIHPDDWDILQNYPYVFSKHLCIGIEDKYAIIQFGNYIFRVLSEIFQPALEPKYKPMVKVKFLNSKGLIEFGIIKGIHWHNKDEKYYYDLEINGKIKGRRYYDVDLEIM
jgi:hypothetical protein